MLPKAEFVTYSARARTQSSSEFPSASRRKCSSAAEASPPLRRPFHRRWRNPVEHRGHLPHDFRSEVERYGTLFAVAAGTGRQDDHRARRADVGSEARVMLACDERLRLPPLSMIHRCPILIERDGKPVMLATAITASIGGRYIASNAKIRIMSLEEAVEPPPGVDRRFSFRSHADKSRAIVAIITPALRFGGLLRCHFPAILVEADRPQAGKGTLVEAIQRFYGELNELTAKRKGGVGSFDEEMSRQLLRGRPFIQIDNIRDSLDSEFFEHCHDLPFRRDGFGADALQAGDKRRPEPAHLSPDIKPSSKRRKTWRPARASSAS